MKEVLYTIPVNEGFEADDECPFCFMERQWLTAVAFNDLIAIAESTPGPIVVNAATFVAMQLGGLPGAVVSTIAAVIPGFLIAFSLGLLYQRYRSISPIQGAMDGLRPVVVALIFVGGVKVMRNALLIGGLLSFAAVDWMSVALFVGAIVVLRKWKVNPVLVILGGGAAGGVYVPYPIRVTVGGATIFVLEVSQFLKV